MADIEKTTDTEKKTRTSKPKTSGAGTAKAGPAPKAAQKEADSDTAGQKKPAAKAPRKGSTVKTAKAKKAVPKPKPAKPAATKKASTEKKTTGTRKASGSKSAEAKASSSKSAEKKITGDVKSRSAASRIPKSRALKAKPTEAPKTTRKSKSQQGSSSEVQAPDSKDQHIDWFSLFSDYDINLFKSGKHLRLYNKLGAQTATHRGTKGVYFAVWAPNARSMHVVGDFNNWNRSANPMNPRWDGSGIWETFIPGLEKGELYKYFIQSHTGYEAEKGDPYATLWETPPQTSSKVWETDFEWSDDKWLKEREKGSPLEKPISIYELHPGSWRKVPEEGDRYLTYRELAKELVAYCKEIGFTHVELMPVMEHPFYGSWGYQLIGYFAPSSRYGTPDDFAYMVNELHRAGIGVILDWVPSHFPTDEHGLDYFDGTHLYEHDDPRQGFHPDWKSNIFNYGRNEVRAFLLSNALFWLDKYHIDGLRVDAVASMIYRDYSRKEGEWVPNAHGGRDNLEAISLLKEFNQAVHEFHPGTFTVAEESTAYPGVTHSPESGGLGFDMKWMMGWMHDTLDYMQKEPVYRKYHQGQITFSLHYAFTEKFVLPLSHDEVVYGKKSLINKMPGDDWQQFANLRLLYSYMYGHPGAKLIFMGGDFGQRHEWRHDFSLDWHEAEYPLHKGVQKVLRDLNALYKSEPALYARNFDPHGFEWIDYKDDQNSVLAWVRKGENPEDELVFVANFTPVVRENYRIGIPQRGFYAEIFNSDEGQYGGSNQKTGGEHETAPIPVHGREQSVSITLPPLAVAVLKHVPNRETLI